MARRVRKVEILFEEGVDGVLHLLRQCLLAFGGKESVIEALPLGGVQLQKNALQYQVAVEYYMLSGL